jgi:hypothetical protein
MPGDYIGFASNQFFDAVGPDKPKIYELKPSGKFRVLGAVRVASTQKICKNGWIDKDGNVLSSQP